MATRSRTRSCISAPAPCWTRLASAAAFDPRWRLRTTGASRRFGMPATLLAARGPPPFVPEGIEGRGCESGGEDTALGPSRRRTRDSTDSKPVPGQTPLCRALPRLGMPIEQQLLREATSCELRPHPEQTKPQTCRHLVKQSILNKSQINHLDQQTIDRLTPWMKNK